MNEGIETADLPTQDERVMAALAHAGVVWPALGLVAPLVIWGTQREKSRFVGFQALQAAAYQFILILGGLVASVCCMCSFVIFPLAERFAAPLPRAWADVVMCVPVLTLSCAYGATMLTLLLLWLAYLGYGLFGAVMVIQGQNFRYAFLGRWLERYLEQA